jgi:Ser/Thr protein kinase RdoA (MazF antagonist)
MTTIDPKIVIASLMPAWRTAQIKNLIFLEGGYSNENYRFEYEEDLFVVKIAGNSGLILCSEAKFLELSVAPEVIALDRHSGHLITRWIHGDSLVDITVNPYDAGLYLRKLHAAIPNGIAAYDPMDVIRRNLRSSTLSREVGEIWHSLRWTVDQITGCHNDLNPMNIIRSGATWRTLDWETAGDNDPIFDLVGFAYGLGYDDNSFADFVSHYFNNHRFTPSSNRLITTRLLFQMREHTWALSQLQLGNDRAEIRKQVIDAERELIRLTKHL